MPVRLESQAEPIPGYRLIERLGGGGFGEVWKAEAPGGLHKAIKFCFGEIKTAYEDGDQGHRAEQEFKAINRVKSVRHPYILSIERLDIIDGQFMIVMELADKNLWDRFRECKAEGLPGIPREELLRYMEESAEALDLMNLEHQLQHLDIKPQNIFLVHNHIKVADFGLVKDFQGVAASITGGVTPVYAAPETFDGMVTRFCDQYSLGIVYQEMLTGQRPFAGTNIHQLVMQHVSGRPNLSALSPKDQAIVGRALSKNPDDRFPSCAELVRALRAATAPTTTARLSEPAYVPQFPGFPDRPFDDDAGPATRIEPMPSYAPPETTAPVAPDAPGETQSTRRMVQVDVKPPADKPAPKPPPALKPEPPEITGDGELFPAFVVGLGGMGLRVLLLLHEAMARSFGSGDAVPTARFFGIDTDTEAVQAAIGEEGSGRLPPSSVLHAKLSRAIHYMKPREGRPRLDAWFDSGMLNRLPRDLTTGGLRTLGRLAFIDNYRNFMQRFQAEVKTALDPDTMASTIGQTGLSLRTNRPRVYVVTSLGGGTGSGMFLDLAYSLRHQLRQAGYHNPEVVGVLLLPAVDKSKEQKLAQVNTFAALTELNHFSAPQASFVSKFDDKEGTINDPQPPFRRVCFMPLPAKENKEGCERILRIAAEFLFCDMLTPLGRVADKARASAPTPETAPTLLGQNFALTRFWWPRWELLRRSAQSLCRNLATKWISKDCHTPPELIKQWVQEQWTQKELSVDLQIARLQAACERALGQAPETAFALPVDPFIAKRWGSKVLDVKAVREASDRIHKLLGHPSASSVLYKPGTLEEVLTQEADAMVAGWEKNLLTVTQQLLEQPEFHFAGAEEALRQLIAMIDQALKHHEALCTELTKRAQKTNDRVQFFMQNLDEIANGGRKAAQLITELLDNLKGFPKFRYQSMMLKLVNSTCARLRGRLSDQLREIGFSRSRLGELQRALDELQGADSGHGGALDANQLLPTGCSSLEEAITRFVAAVTPAEFESLDRHMHNLVQVQFRGLVNLCNSSSSMFRKLAAAMLEEATTYAGSRLAASDVVEMFLGQYPRAEEARSVLVEAYEKAAPASYVTGITSPTEFCVLATPPSAQEDQLRALAAEAVPEAKFVPAPSADDIIIYREEARFALGELEQVGPLYREAYRQTMMKDPLTPHARTDITEWRDIGD